MFGDSTSSKLNGPSSCERKVQPCYFCKIALRKQLENVANIFLFAKVEPRLFLPVYFLKIFSHERLEGDNKD